MIERAAIARRYWIWQQRKMQQDNVGYTVDGPLSWLRPLAVKWINVNTQPGGITPVPAGWRVYNGYGPFTKTWS